MGVRTQFSGLLARLRIRLHRQPVTNTPRPVSESYETLHWLYSVEQQSVIPIKWLMLLFSISLLLLQDRSLLFESRIFLSLSLYGILNIGFTWLFLFGIVGVERFRLVSYLSLVCDVFFVSALILFTGGLDSHFYYLFFLIILRSAALFQDPLRKLWSDLFMTVIYLSCAIPATTVNPADPLTPLVLRVTLLWGVILTSSFLVQVLTFQQARIFSINERLRYQIEQNREVFSSMTDAVLVFDKSQQLRLCNLSGEILLSRILGIHANQESDLIAEHTRYEPYRNPPRLFHSEPPQQWDPEVLTRFWWSLTPDRICTPIERLLDEVRFKPYGRVEGVPVLLTEKSGRKKSMVASVASFGERTEGRLGWMILLKDISEYQSLEKQLLSAEKLAAVGRLASGLAHELGNPLGIIKSCATYLAKKLESNSDLCEEARVLVSEADRCGKILKQLLTFASQEQLRLSEVDLSQILANAVNLVTFQAPSEITMDYHSECASAPTQTDEGLLTQAFVNLLLNAVQSIEKSGWVRVSLSQNEAREYQITITDSGSGMGKETLARLYDPFYTTKPTGTGLGLAITLRIFHRLGGSISVKSEPGHGTTFTLTHPQRVEEDTHLAGMNPGVGHVTL
jgi:signal transduction histidine kinase